MNPVQDLDLRGKFFPDLGLWEKKNYPDLGLRGKIYPDLGLWGQKNYPDLGLWGKIYPEISLLGKFNLNLAKCSFCFATGHTNYHYNYFSYKYC